MNFSWLVQSRLLALSKAGWFALFFALFGFAQASDSTAATDDGKSLRQSISSSQTFFNAIDSGVPDIDPVSITFDIVCPPVVLRSLGNVLPGQHNPMVLQLRDRLMHAPPIQG